jgi:hypothetical protein
VGTKTGMAEPLRAAGAELLSMGCLGGPSGSLIFADICGALKLFVKVAGIRSDAF